MITDETIHWLPNLGVGTALFFCLVATLITFAVAFVWVEHKHAKANRKGPFADFDDEI